MSRVARELRDNPAAREELAKIERSLKPLEESYEPVEPPPSDLIARTLANLPPLPAVGEETVPSELVPMHSGVDAPKSSSMTWIDWASGAVAAAVLLGLLLPSLAQGRFEARKIACQDNLRQLHTALARFVNRNQQSRLPAVSEFGPEAFAGMYAVRLHEQGLLEDPSIRWCASVSPPDRRVVGSMDPNEMVSTADLYQASVDRLRQIQRFVGGHYAYTLGVVDQDHLMPPRFESRSSFAVMSDAPMIGMPRGELRSDRIGHSGFGINVLFEDGRVQFITLSSLESMPDHPLLNHRGRAEAGVNIDDASLAPSSQPPFIGASQR